MEKVGRNDPCPCGSGKKYKKCCLRESYSPPGIESATQSSLIQKLLAFGKRHHKDTLGQAMEFFWSPGVPEEHLNADYLEMADINFWDWFVYDWEIDQENGKRLIDLYMESVKSLGTEEKVMLGKMRDTFLSLFEVQEVFPEKGLLLKDLIAGGEYEVREKMATRSLRKWDILAARLLHLDGDYIMSGSVYPYPLRIKEDIIADINGSFKKYRKDHPDDSVRDFLKRNGVLFNQHWCEVLRKPLRPALVTKDGESMVFCTALFEIKDEKGAIDGLKTMANLAEVEKGRFHWLDEPESDGSATILGTIGLTDDSLKLECRSKERLERGKSLILDALGDFVAHKIDTFQDPYQALKNLPRVSSKGATEIPPEVKQELYIKYMQQHYEKWLNEKLPALKGRTPLEAAKRPSGKEKVAEILKTMENSEEHNKLAGQPYYDVSWLWERLGIER